MRDGYLQAVQVDVYNLGDGRVGGFIGTGEGQVDVRSANSECYGRKVSVGAFSLRPVS